MDNSKPKEAFIFMKVGDYGAECLEGIIERKNREREKEGKMFWGYGETSFIPFNPKRQVQPFVKKWLKKQDSIEVLMERTPSNPKEPDYDGRKKENQKKKYSADDSVDEKNWCCFSPEIRTDSIRALVLDEIRACHMHIDLRDYKVGIDPSKGEYAIDYLAFRGMKKLTGKTHRRDKGCLVKAKSRKRGIREVQICITYRAYLKHPYAVFLR